MSEQSIKCLYCQGENKQVQNSVHNNNCEHCGMLLPKKHPQDKHSKINFFIKVFWVIVLFCLIMMFYLPR